MKMQSEKNLRGGFTILEVMIAVAIFFVGTFGILALVSQSLDNARRLQRPLVDAGMLASQLSLTNQLFEGTESGNAGDLLGDNYNGYTWTREIVEEQTNKLFRVTFTVSHTGADKPLSQMTVLFYRPQSPAGSMDGATVVQ